MTDGRQTIIHDDERIEASRRRTFWVAVSVTALAIFGIWAFTLPSSLRAQDGVWQPFTGGASSGGAEAEADAKAAFSNLKTRLQSARAALTPRTASNDEDLMRLRARLEEEAQKNSTEPIQP